MINSFLNFVFFPSIVYQFTENQRATRVGDFPFAAQIQLYRTSKDSWVPDEYQTYFRVLETEDEYFPYHKRYHAFWKMYGIGLSDEVLKKIYYKNAMRLIRGIDASLFPE